MSVACWARPGSTVRTRLSRFLTGYGPLGRIWSAWATDGINANQRESRLVCALGWCGGVGWRLRVKQQDAGQPAAPRRTDHSAGWSDGFEAVGEIIRGLIKTEEDEPSPGSHVSAANPKWARRYQVSSGTAVPVSPRHLGRCPC